MRAGLCPLCVRRLLFRLTAGDSRCHRHTLATGSKTHYEVLGVSPDATLKDIKNAFYTLSKKYHPDVTGQPSDSAVTENFVRIRDAYEVLKDTEKRKQYDLLLLPERYNSDYIRYERAAQNQRPGGTPYSEQDYAQIFEHFRKQYSSTAYQARMYDMRRRAYEHQMRMRAEYTSRRGERERTNQSGNEYDFEDLRRRGREWNFLLLNKILTLYLTLFFMTFFIRALLYAMSGDWRLQSERRRRGSDPEPVIVSVRPAEQIQRMIAEQPVLQPLTDAASAELPSGWRNLIKKSDGANQIDEMIGRPPS